MTDTTDEADILETAGDDAPDASEASEDTDSETLKERLAQAQEYGRNQKIRAEKAEKQSKGQVQEEATTTSHDLSSKDTIALINAKVHEDDVDEVVEYASFKKISLAEALKSSVVKTLLAERVEQRSTADATSTGKTRSGQAKVTGESLLQKAKKTGEVPEREEDLDALLEQRLKPKE